MKKKPTPQKYTFETKSDFKAWRQQRVNAGKLLDTIIFRWRNSNAHTPNDPSPWATWPLATWAEWVGWGTDAAGLKKVKRALAELVLNELIERKRYPFAGKTFRAYLRPTKLALQYAGRPQDLERVKSLNVPTNVPTNVPMNVPMSVPTDHTPFPSLPPSPSKSPSPSSKSESACAHGKGKEGFGETPNAKDDFKSYKLKFLKLAKKFVQTGKHYETLNDEEKDIVESYAKKIKELGKQFPELKGAHEKSVVYPGNKWPNWPWWSPEKRKELYEAYKNYVANWYAGKNGTPYTQYEEVSDEEWAKVSASIQAQALSDHDESNLKSVKLI